MSPISTFCIFQRNAELTDQTNAVEIKKDDTTTNFATENPPFFPSTIEELAYDVAFTTKVALINRIKRIRVDVRMRLTNKDRYMLKWLLLTSINLLDDSDENSNVHIFIDKTPDVIRCQELWMEIVNESTRNILSRGEISDDDKSDEIKKEEEYLNKLSKIHISSISDVHLQDQDTILVIFNPDNMVACEHENLLEDVQALCFHAALRKIPVVLINPQLMATAWNDYGARTPLLLSDFAQAYYICDDYFMFSRRDQWCGIVQRAETGFDLYLLEGFPSVGQTFPKSYIRLQNWPLGMPYDVKSYLSKLLLNDPNFPLQKIFDAENLINHGIRDSTHDSGKEIGDDSVEELAIDNDIIHKDSDIVDISKSKKVDSKSGWRNIVPAPRSSKPDSVKPKITWSGMKSVPRLS
jgi:hypothetical protein